MVIVEQSLECSRLHNFQKNLRWEYRRIHYKAFINNRPCCFTGRFSHHIVLHGWLYVASILNVVGFSSGFIIRFWFWFIEILIWFWTWFHKIYCCYRTKLLLLLLSYRRALCQRKLLYRRYNIVAVKQDCVACQATQHRLLPDVLNNRNSGSSICC